MQRTLHGIFAFTPLVFAVLMILMHIGILPFIDLPDAIYLVIAGFFIVGIILSLRIIYGQKKVSDGHKSLWTMLIIGLNVLTLPVFWAIYVYPKNPNKRKRKKRK